VLRITYTETEKEKEIETLLDRIKRYYKRENDWKTVSAGIFASITDDELKTIGDNIRKALEKNIISIEYLKFLYIVTVRDLFNNIYGIQALSEQLFTPSEADVIQTSTFKEFMTEKGMALLRNTKGQTSITKLANLKPDELDAAIDIGYVDPIDVTVQRLCNSVDSSFDDKSRDELIDIRHNIYSALEEKIVLLEDVSKLLPRTVRDIFSYKYGCMPLMALQESLFTLAEANKIEGNIFEEFMTGQGIMFLRNIKGKIPIMDFVDHLERHERVSAIVKGNIEKDVIDVIEDRKRAQQERRSQYRPRYSRPFSSM